MQNDFASIAEQFHLSLIILFGSQATHTQGTMSDIDVLVHRRMELSLTEGSDLTAAFASAFHATDEQIDLVFLCQASGLLRMEALYKGKVLFGDPIELNVQRIRAFRRLLDEQRFIKSRRAFLKQKFQGCDPCES
ncbi:MAG: nucleotidyltransferase domain-containing protein [Nitrospirota bacterium]